MATLLVFQGIAVVFDGLCIGGLLTYLIPADPRKLPRALAWLVADWRKRRSGSPVPERVYRWLVSLIALGVLGVTQYGLVYRLLLDPWPAWQSGPSPAVWFTLDEIFLAIWTIYLVWAFHRAADGFTE